MEVWPGKEVNWQLITAILPYLPNIQTFNILLEGTVTLPIRQAWLKNYVDHSSDWSVNHTHFTSTHYIPLQHSYPTSIRMENNVTPESPANNARLIINNTHVMIKHGKKV